VAIAYTVGDLLLFSMAARLFLSGGASSRAHRVPALGLLARYGGDEFGVIMAGCAPDDAAGDHRPPARADARGRDDLGRDRGLGRGRERRRARRARRPRAAPRQAWRARPHRRRERSGARRAALSGAGRARR
jgi:GGDEF domain-containing protein